MYQESSLLRVTEALSLQRMPQECERSTWSAHTHTSISRAWVDGSRSRIPSLYPTSGSETAQGFLTVRFVFESSSRVWASTLTWCLRPSVGRSWIRCIHVTLEWCWQRCSPDGELWHISRADRQDQGSKAALILWYKWVLPRLSW